MPWTFPTADGPLTVDEARLEDASALVALHREVLAERDWFITLPAEFSGAIDAKIRMIRDYARQTNSVFLVARQDAKVLGFVTVQGGVLQRMRHAGKLEIMLARDARGRGVGKALMTAVIEWATANPDLHKLGLSVFATNERAIALYKAFGFVEEGRRPREYRMEDGSYRDDVLLYRFVKP